MGQIRRQCSTTTVTLTVPGASGVGGNGLCMDLIDRPDEVERALNEVRAVTQSTTLLKPATWRGGDRSGWAPFYEGRFATIQCDYICLIGPKQARRFALPR